MTNEKIAKVMGWVSVKPTKYSLGYYSNKEEFIMWKSKFKPNEHIKHAKLLQAKMVDDGWDISIHHWKEESPDFEPKINFSAYAKNYNKKANNDFFADSNSEPSVIVSLFEKIYGEKKNEKVKKCKVPRCTNKDSAGVFVGNLCGPCYRFIVEQIRSECTASNLRDKIYDEHNNKVELFWKKMDGFLKENKKKENRNETRWSGL